MHAYIVYFHGICRFFQITPFPCDPMILKLTRPNLTALASNLTACNGNRAVIPTINGHFIHDLPTQNADFPWLCKR